jgi:hypothetical protein
MKMLGPHGPPDRRTKYTSDHYRKMGWATLNGSDAIEQMHRELGGLECNHAHEPEFDEPGV